FSLNLSQVKRILMHMPIDRKPLETIKLKEQVISQSSNHSNTASTYPPTQVLPNANDQTANNKIASTTGTAAPTSNQQMDASNYQFFNKKKSCRQKGCEIIKKLGVALLYVGVPVLCGVIGFILGGPTGLVIGLGIGITIDLASNGLNETLATSNSGTGCFINSYP
ncbi:MAG: hypothetical protein K2Q14_05995, partial [Gammaproteobacteria bacterium]|nr:hypothetical protein [Gammaproteobacteria bacterium]